MSGHLIGPTVVRRTIDKLSGTKYPFCGTGKFVCIPLNSTIYPIKDISHTSGCFLLFSWTITARTSPQHYHSSCSSLSVYNYVFGFYLTVEITWHNVHLYSVVKFGDC